MEFVTRGHRRREGWGLRYASRDGRFAVYKSYQCDGIALPVRWLALQVTRTGEHLISRHRTRRAAERACQRKAK